MPELPDIKVYVDALSDRIQGHTLEGMRINNPFVVRSTSPMPSEVAGLAVTAVGHQAKRIVIALERDVRIFIHLMIAGRLRWEPPKKAIPKKVGLAALDFPSGTLILTEQGTKRRAGLWVLRGEEAVAAEDRGGVEPLEMDVETMAEALRSENRTLKRALTDPRRFSGIGNAYSDEILWEAQLAPTTRTRSLTDEEMERLHGAIQTSLRGWADRLREEVGEGWPTKVTAFRPDMAVHGKYGQPCPRCGSPVQRIVYADNETNYCATCQTEGKLLADRSLSRLLKDDWPKHVDELE